MPEGDDDPADESPDRLPEEDVDHENDVPADDDLDIVDAIEAANDEGTQLEDELDTLEASENDPDGAESGDPFDELLDRVEEEPPERDDRSSEESGDQLGGAFDLLEQEGPTEVDQPPGFDDLLERVETQERRRKSAKGSQSDRHELASLRPIKYASSILVIGALGSEPDDDTCLSAFELAPLEDQRVLLVTLGRRGPTRLELFLERFEIDQLAALAHVGRLSGAHHAPEDVLRTAEVSDPEDLTQLGISISMIVSDWMETSDQITICLHSLTALLQYVSDQRVFRFLHLLLGRLEDAGATVHVHADAETHAPQVIGLYRELFDVMVEVTDEGLEVRA